MYKITLSFAVVCIFPLFTNNLFPQPINPISITQKKKYLKSRKVDVEIANNSIIEKNILKKYETLEQKDQVILDEENIDIEIIQNDYVNIQDEVIRHKVDKLALDIYAYLIRQE